MSWQPEEEQLRQLVQCLKDSLAGQNPGVQKNAEIMLKTARSSTDFDKYLAYVFSSSSPPPAIQLNPAHYAQARAAAVIMLKNDIKTSYKAMPDSTKEYIRSTILVSLQDPASQMRGYAGNVITEVVRQGGIMG